MLEDLGHLLPWLYEVIDELHVNLLAYDYRGYGLNSPWGVDHCSEEVYRLSFCSLASLPPLRLATVI